MSIPAPYAMMRKQHPSLIAAYESLVAECATSGPLDPKTIALLKLAISLGAGLEGAAHSHARKALEAGWSSAELLHLATITAPTIGFPAMMRSREWVTDVMGEDQ